jgi:hypothetical protein
VRNWISEAGAAPPANAPAAEKFGYVGGDVAQVVGTGGGTAIGKGALELGKVGLTAGAGELIGSSLGFPGAASSLTAIVLRHLSKEGINAIKGAIKDAAKEGAEQAGKGAAKEVEAGLPKNLSGEITKRGPLGAAKSQAKNEWGLRASPGWTPEMQAALEKSYPQAGSVPPAAKPRVRVPAGRGADPIPGKFPWKDAAE